MNGMGNSLMCPTPEIYLAQSTHTNFGECAASCITPAGAYTAVNNPCTVIKFMVGTVEFFWNFC